MNLTAQRLAQAMTKSALDQSELAGAIGVTQGAISKILDGKTANSRLMPKIAARLRVPLPWLLGMTDDPSIDAAEAALTSEDREWLDLLHALTPRDRAAALQLIRSLAHSAQVPMLQAQRQEFGRE